MKVNVGNIHGAALNWATATADGAGTDIIQYGGRPAVRFEHSLYLPSSKWEQGGPIIERELIYVMPSSRHEGEWQAVSNYEGGRYETIGATPLEAAMRCFVASRFGNFVEIPDELCDEKESYSTVKTDVLLDTALDWAVAKALGMLTCLSNGFLYPLSGPEEEFNPSMNWAQAGPIIESAGIELTREGDDWLAGIYPSLDELARGPTALIAAMRCFVASELGDEVRVPDEVLSESVETPTQRQAQRGG